jgi:hypothetical protein
MLIACQQLFRLTRDTLVAAESAESLARKAKLAAMAQYAEIRVRIEILEDELDLPEAKRIFKGRHDGGEIEQITDLCPEPLDEHETHPGAA